MYIFPLPDEALSIEKGEGTLKVYEFGEKKIAHMVNELSISLAWGTAKGDVY